MLSLGAAPFRSTPCTAPFCYILLSIYYSNAQKAMQCASITRKQCKTIQELCFPMPIFSEAPFFLNLKDIEVKHQSQNDWGRVLRALCCCILLPALYIKRKKGNSRKFIIFLPLFIPILLGSYNGRSYLVPQTLHCWQALQSHPRLCTQHAHMLAVNMHAAKAGRK